MGKYIFLVEDNDGDALLIEEAFRALGRTQHTIERARNGEEAVERLANDNAPRPDLVLLDINMPRMNGFEVLETVRQTHADTTLAIVMLSTSERDQDIRTALSLQANAYVSKADGFDDLITQVDHIDRFWLQTAQKA